MYPLNGFHGIKLKCRLKMIPQSVSWITYSNGFKQIHSESETIRRGFTLGAEHQQRNIRNFSTTELCVRVLNTG